LRILLINYEFPPLGGGAGNASYFIARELVRLGHEITVMTSGFKGLPAAEERDGIRIVRIPVLRRRVDRCSVFEMSTYILSALAHSRAIMKSAQPQRCLVFFGIPGGPVGLWLKLWHGLPYVLSLRGGDVPRMMPGALGFYHRLTAPLSRLIWRSASQVCANGARLRELAISFEPSLAIESIPNGVDLGLEQAGSSAAQGLQLIFVGRLSPEKGLEHLFEAISLLQGAHPEVDIRLTLAGDGPSRSNLEALAHQLKLQERITFKGWMAKGDLAQIYRPGTVCVHPSLDDGLPNAALEAMAAGIPLITTSVLAQEGLIEPGVEGFLVKPGDSQALAEAIAYFLDKPEAIIPMGQRARARVAQHFGWPTAAAAYARLLEA